MKTSGQKELVVQCGI